MNISVRERIATRRKLLKRDMVSCTSDCVTCFKLTLYEEMWRWYGKDAGLLENYSELSSEVWQEWAKFQETSKLIQYQRRLL